MSLAILYIMNTKPFKKKYEWNIRGCWYIDMTSFSFLSFTHLHTKWASIVWNECYLGMRMYTINKVSIQWENWADLQWWPCASWPGPTCCPRGSWSGPCPDPCATPVAAGRQRQRCPDVQWRRSLGRRRPECPLNYPKKNMGSTVEIKAIYMYVQYCRKLGNIHVCVIL